MARRLELASLFYRLELDSKGFGNELTNAEKKLGSLTNFIAKNPVVALGALGAAAVSVGVAATQMAADVDAAMRKVAVSVPGATERLSEMKDVGRELATEFGISQTEIARVMQLVAETGVESTDELIEASRAAVRYTTLAQSGGSDGSRVA